MSVALVKSAVVANSIVLTYRSHLDVNLNACAKLGSEIPSVGHAYTEGTYQKCAHDLVSALLVAVEREMQDDYSTLAPAVSDLVDGWIATPIHSYSLKIAMHDKVAEALSYCPIYVELCKNIPEMFLNNLVSLLDDLGVSTITLVGNEYVVNPKSDNTLGRHSWDAQYKGVSGSCLQHYAH